MSHQPIQIRTPYRFWKIKHTVLIVFDHLNCGRFGGRVPLYAGSVYKLANALIECTNDFCKNIKLLYIYKGRQKNREKRCCIIIFVITELINFYSYFFINFARLK